MPCIRNDNGRAVPGEKGRCPIGSSWSDTADNNKFDWQDVGTFAKRRYFDEKGNIRPVTTAIDLGTAALVANPVGAGIRGAMAVGTKGIPWLMGRMFGKKVAEQAAKTTSTRVPKIASDVMTPIAKRNKVIPRFRGGNPATGLPIRSGTFKPVATQSINRVTSPAIAAGRKFSPLRSAAVVGAGAQGVDYVAPFTQAGLENKQARDALALETAQANKLADQKVVDANATAALEAQKESDRVAGLGFFDKMKEPGYWDTSITGVEGDDRLSRMGDLLTYYGMPPSGRAAAGQTPSEMWKQRSIDAAAAVAGASGVDSPYSKIGDKTGINSIIEKVKKDFGNTWLPFDVALGARLNDDEVAALANEIHIEIVKLADMPEHIGKMPSQLYEIAKKNYESRR